jgi:hypothetical protein
MANGERFKISLLLFDALSLRNNMTSVRLSWLRH